MLEPFQGKAVQVDEIPGDMQFGDLPLPLAQVLVPAHPSVEQQGRSVQALRCANDRCLRRDLARFRNQRAHRSLLLGRHDVARAQFQQVLFDHVSITLRASIGFEWLLPGIRTAQAASRSGAHGHARSMLARGREPSLAEQPVNRCFQREVAAAFSA